MPIWALEAEHAGNPGESHPKPVHGALLNGSSCPMSARRVGFGPEPQRSEGVDGAWDS